MLGRTRSSRLILQYINPIDHCRDYDARYPIHLAAAEGEVVSVEFLIYAHAEINIKDRWGCVHAQLYI